MKIRGALVPVVNLASNAWIFLLMMGIFLNIAGLTTAAIVMYAAVVIFQLVTLPVEFNAAARDGLHARRLCPQAEQAGSFNVLRACALTYVAAALTSILQLLWLLGQRRLAASHGYGREARQDGLGAALERLRGDAPRAGSPDALSVSGAMALAKEPSRA